MSFMLIKNIGMALHTIRSSRGRSFLTMLGVIIAVAAVTSVVSIGDGIRTALAHQTNQYSRNVITVRPGRIGGGSGSLAGFTAPVATTALSRQDATIIGKVPHVISSVPLITVAAGAHGDHDYRGPVFAASSDLPDVVNQELEYGVFFTTHDNDNMAVLGADAADKLFDQRVPLGRGFTINGHQFIVSGVLTKFGSTPFTSDSNYNNAIFVPEAATKVLSENNAPVYEVLAKVSDSGDLDQTGQAISQALAKQHGGQDDFDVLTPSQLASQTTQSFNLLTDLIVAAAVITLIVSGIGIMNVMLVSVTERIHEIGIRKAVGATNHQILNQFITEAATMCVVGSLLGAALTFAAIWFLRVFSNLTPVFNWHVAGLSCLAACLFGIIFGTLPAVKAARKDPIAALRNE